MSSEPRDDPLDMAEHRLDARDPTRIAAAVIGYQLAGSSFRVPVAIAVVAGALIGLGGDGPTGLVVGVVVALVVCAAVVVFQRRALARRLARTAYRPGTTLRLTFDAAAFTLVTAAGPATYPYDRIQHCRTLGDVHVVRLLGARSVVALPASLVAADRRSLLDPR